eukprot:2531043-Pyramimonas_sp.AAC.1
MFWPGSLDFGGQRCRWAVVQLRGSDEQAVLRPSNGGLMGDGFAVRSSVHTFEPAVERWRAAQHEWDRRS